MPFNDLLQLTIKKHNSMLCVGLDPIFDKIPAKFKNQEEPLYEFCKYIVDETSEFASCFKPNSAFFEAEGSNGLAQLKKIVNYIKSSFPELLVILDAKRGDIDSTNEGYVKFAFSYFKADAITLSPYLGREAMTPFLNLKEKGCIFLCKTSNNGSAEFQNLQLVSKKNLKVDKSESSNLFEYLAKQIEYSWNENNNCMLVAGATNPNDLKKIRECAPTLPILIPGVGAQGGDLKLSVQNASDSNKSGILIAVSRSIIYSDNPRKEAGNIRDEINSYL